MQNLAVKGKGKKKSPKTPGSAKSPSGKKGKTKTTWDNVVFGGKVKIGDNSL